MVSQAFDGTITNGKPRLADSYESLEGQRESIAVSPKVSADGPELSVVFDVEKDVSIRIPFVRQAMTDLVPGDARALKPCLIVPEEICDE